MNIKIGCDPELFVQDGHTFISAHGLIPGTKEEPHEVEKGAIQVDGFAAEFNIDPAETAEEFDKNIETVITQLLEHIHKVDKKLTLAYVPYAKFTEGYFMMQPFESKVLGCDPDFTSMGFQQVPPEDLTNEPFRTAAGHIHIGWTEDERPFHPDHFSDCMKISKAFKGEKWYQPVTLLEHLRLNYYGSNGAFRPKRYGIELRAPSNRWVKRSETRREIFHQTMNRFKLVRG